MGWPCIFKGSWAPDSWIKASVPFFLKKILIWLHWVLVAAHTIFVVAHGLSSCGAWALEPTGSIALQHVESQFPNQGLTLHTLHCKVDS